VADRNPIKVGILFSETGVTSAIETSLLFGTLLAVEEVNEAGGIDGREIVPVRYDPRSDSNEYRQLAERLVSVDGVRVIFGCYMSSTRKAVIPVVERWSSILFYPTLYEGFEFSNNLIYTGAVPNQNSVQLADYMTSVFGPRVYMIGSNYIYPRESNRIMEDFVRERTDGDILGERYLDFSATEDDFKRIITEVKILQPDFIFSTVVGNATRLLYRAYADAGIDPAKMAIASLTTTEVEIAQMGADICAGHITSAPYFQSVDSELNKRCVKNYFRRFDDAPPPNACWEAAYFQVHLFANAMRSCGSDEFDALMPSLLGSQILAPQGRVQLDPGNHHAWLYPRIGRANAAGQFTIVRESAQSVSPDPYLVKHSLEGELRAPCFRRA
jgi:branched-chain amino acid transport system substrate-binding protein